MTRYQTLRYGLGCDPLTAALIAALNSTRGVPNNEIRIMTAIIEFDPELPVDALKQGSLRLEDYF